MKLQTFIDSWTSDLLLIIMDIKGEAGNTKNLNPPKLTQIIEPKRFLLYDNLIVDIVDFDEKDGSPIVEFSMCRSEEEAAKLPVECGICPDVMHKTRLDKHIETHIQYVDNVKRYTCIYCQEHFATRASAAGHFRRHEGVRPYVCEECKIYYCTKEDFKMHNRRRHSTKDHICEICGRTFTENSTLRSHILSAHEQQKRFSCEHCGKRFLRRYGLREHIQNVHLLNRRPLRCKFCDKNFTDAHRLAQHRKEEHLNQSSFKCHTCGVEFNTIEFFDAHKRSIQCRNKNHPLVKSSNDQGEAKVSEYSDMTVEVRDKYTETHEIITEQGVLKFQDNGHAFVENDNEILYEISVDDLTEM